MPVDVSFPFTRPGSRVALRPLSLDDLDAIMLWINDPRVTRNFAGLSKTITREEEERFLSRSLASQTDVLYAIVDLEGRYLGNAGLHKIYWPARNGRLGIVLGAEEARGRGLGLEALSLLCELAFRHHGLHKLWAMHYASNDRMAHILGSLGFVEEGRLREEYFHEGAFHDMVRSSLLDREFSVDTP